MSVHGAELITTALPWIDNYNVQLITPSQLFELGERSWADA
jgi:hypothetical protein